VIGIRLIIKSITRALPLQDNLINSRSNFITTHYRSQGNSAVFYKDQLFLTSNHSRVTINLIGMRKGYHALPQTRQRHLLSAVRPLRVPGLCLPGFLRGEEGRVLAEYEYHRAGARHEPEHGDRQD